MAAGIRPDPLGELALFWDIIGRVEKYYFAEQSDFLFIDVSVCLCLVWGRRQTT